jgi:hypothetical protein
MFNLLGKAWTQLVAGLHDLLDRFSDAGRTARQGVRELDGQIRQAEESVTDVAAELRLMQHESDKQGSAADKWGRVAKIAADNGDRNGAVEAVQHQVQAEELAQNYAANVARLTPMLLDTIATLERIRDELLPLLEQVHGGQLLDDEDRKLLNGARTDLNRYMKDEVGVTIDIAAELADIRKPLDQAPASSGPRGEQGAERRVEQQLTTSSPVAQARGMDDFLNPLNPLSPLSPISPWSVWHSSARAEPSDESREYRHHGGVDSTYSAPATDDNRRTFFDCSGDTSFSSASDWDSGSSGGSDSCSDSSSSDSSSSSD